jgi:2-methylcitrate dehydratase PrpD
VTLGYDIGARIVQALGADELSKRFDPSCVATSFVSAAVSAALLRLNQRQVRHTISYAAQQASGMAIWRRDPDHIEKAFDFGGAGSRNGVMAATMVALGFTGVEDPFSGQPSIFSALAERPAPEKLLADLGSKYSFFDTTIKKWSVGSPMQSVVNCMDELLKDPDVTAANVAHVTIDMPAYTLSIVDNATSPDLSAQHLIAMMLVDHGLTFASIHDEKRMKDPKVLALRPLIELRGSDELNVAKPARQAIMKIDLKNGRSVSYHTVYVRGLSQNPMTKDEVEAKAVDLMNPVLGQARTKDLIAAVNRIDTFGPISGLRPLLQA